MANEGMLNDGWTRGYGGILDQYILNSYMQGEYERITRPQHKMAKRRSRAFMLRELPNKNY